MSQLNAETKCMEGGSFKIKAIPFLKKVETRIEL